MLYLGLQGPSNTGQAFATTLEMLHFDVLPWQGEKSLDCVGHPTVMSIDCTPLMLVAARPCYRSQKLPLRNVMSCRDELVTLQGYRAGITSSTTTRSGNIGILEISDVGQLDPRLAIQRDGQRATRVVIGDGSASRVPLFAGPSSTPTQQGKSSR